MMQSDQNTFWLTVMVKISSSYCISQTSEDKNPVIYGMESPDHTYSHTFISFSFWRFVGTDFKKYFLVLNYSAEYSRSKK